MGTTFILSGFVKVVDPWGTAIKVNEYLAIYNLESLKPLSMAFSIWLCGAELMMGLMLMFKVRIRLISIFALISMSFFTILSLFSATLFPVEDCGCFGDAIKLTPWQTFAKNIVLLPMAAIIWYRYRPDKIFAFNRLELIMATTFFSFAMGLGIYNYLYLPIIDFRPYKIGVNLPSAIGEAYTSIPEIKTVLVYRNITNGRLKEFDLEDVEWQNEAKWEWVETRSETIKEDASLIGEFALFDHKDEEVTFNIITHNGRVNMLCITDLCDISKSCYQSVVSFIQRVQGAGESVVIITPQPIDNKAFNIGGVEVECYNIDPSTMNTMIRAKVGLVVLDDGVIVDKRNCRDL
ncbi:MAG: DoxX protein [Rikenellaceae bacterium]